MIPIKKKRIAFRVIEGEAILVVLDETCQATDSLYTMNETGTAIWQRIDGKKTISQLAEELTREYDIEYEKAKDEIKDFINKLEDLRIIKLR